MKTNPVVPVPSARRRRRAPRARVGGVTLIELMVTLALVTVVAALGAPSFLRLLARHAIAAQAEELQDAVRIGPQRGDEAQRAGRAVPHRARQRQPLRGQRRQLADVAAVRRPRAARGTFAAGDAIVRQHLDVPGA